MFLTGFVMSETMMRNDAACVHRFDISSPLSIVIIGLSGFWFTTCFTMVSNISLFISFSNRIKTTSCVRDRSKSFAWCTSALTYWGITESWSSFITILALNLLTETNIKKIRKIMFINCILFLIVVVEGLKNTVLVYPLYVNRCLKWFQPFASTWNPSAFSRCRKCWNNYKLCYVLCNRLFTSVLVHTSINSLSRLVPLSTQLLEAF